MTSYYKEVLRSYAALEQLLRNHTRIQKSGLIYELTSQFPVSEKRILLRLKLLKKLRMVKIDDDEVIHWIG